ncbi:MAG: hypothetical protein ACRD3T_19375 [Terriglobia bacterium]
MKDDYLWDRSGEPDQEILKLETALLKFRHNRPAPEFPEITQVRRPRSWPRFLFTNRFRRLAAVGTAVLVIAVIWLTLRRPGLAPASRLGWDVTCLAGTPRVGPRAIAKAGATGKLLAGQAVVTDSYSKADIRIAGIGEVEVEPDTDLRLLQTGSRRKLLALDRGTIHAAIWAPPGEFAVDVPSAVAVDLGCAYTLHVDDSGAGLLQTTLGWVGFKRGSRESFIPAGAVCATHPGIGPGTPYFADAPAPFRAAVSKLDFETGGPEQRRAELSIVLSQARKRDALTLWHLLSRCAVAERGYVYGRLATLVPPPAGVTRQGILRLDQKMLDLWWNKLGFGDITLWRTWERAWSQPEPNGK